jgi:hypothetical protein
MSSALHTVDTNSNTQLKKPSSSRPDVPPPPIPARLVISHRKPNSDDGVSRLPPSTPGRTSSLAATVSTHSTRHAEHEDALNEQCNDNNHSEPAFDVMTYTVPGKLLSATMLGIEHRDPVEHGSEVMDLRTGLVLRRKPNGVYFRLMSVDGLEDQLEVGDEVLAVAGYQMADMSLETARYDGLSM